MNRKKFIPSPSVRLLPRCPTWKCVSKFGEPDRRVSQYDAVSAVRNALITSGHDGAVEWVKRDLATGRMENGHAIYELVK